MIHTNSQ